MKKVYLALAILGGLIPYLFFVRFIQVEGVDLSLFVESLFVNGAAGGFSIDLLLSSFVFWLFLFQLSKQPGAPKPFLFILLNLTIGLSCAFPAYLYARESSKKQNRDSHAV